MYFEHLFHDMENLKARYNSFIVTAFDDSMTVEMQMRSYVKFIKDNMKLTNEMVDYLNKFIDEFDENLGLTLGDILDQWYKDGHLASVINNQVFKQMNEELKRLDKIKRNKDDKITKHDFDFSKDEFLFDLSIFDNDTRDKILNGGEMTPKIENLSIKNEYLDTESVTSDKIKGRVVYGNKTENLFNKHDVSERFFVSSKDGLLKSNSEYCASTYIRVKSQQYYYLQGTTEQLAIYDSKLNFVRGLDHPAKENPLVFKVGEDYIRLSMKQTQVDQVMFSEGSNEKKYRPYTLFDSDIIEEKTIKSHQLKNPYVLPFDFDFNKTVAKITDKVVRFDTGTEVDMLGYMCSDYILIDNRYQYKISGTTEQFALFDQNKQYLRGYKSARLLQTADLSNVYYIRFNWLKTDSVKLNSITNIDNEQLSDKNVSINKLKNSVSIYGDVNLFNPDTITENHYVRWDTGTLVKNDGYNASDYIEIDSRQSLYGYGTTEQLSFYDKDYVFVSGLTKLSLLKDYKIPENVVYMRISMKKDQTENVLLKVKNFVNKEDLTNETLMFIKEKIKDSADYDVFVKKGDSLRKALEENQGKTIKLDQGTWVLSDEFSFDEIKNTNFFGYDIGSNILIGSGKDKTFIIGDLEETHTSETVKRVSVFTPKSSFNLKDMTVIGGNVRYAIHPDNSNIDTLNLTNVKVIKQNKGTYCQALGGGVYSNQNHLITNCVFETAWTGDKDIPLSYHSNNNFKNKASVTLKNVKTKGVSTVGFRYGSMLSNQLNNVTLIGCDIKQMYIKEEIFNSGVGFDLDLNGYANTLETILLKGKGSETFEHNLTGLIQNKIE